MARAIGLDPLRLLDAVRIPRAALDDHDLRIPAPALRDLYELSSRNAEDFGLRIVELRSLAVLGPLLLVIREQPTLRAGIDAIIRYSVIHNEASVWQVEDDADPVIVRFVTQYDPPGPNRQVVEAGVYQMMRCMRLFLGPAWRPACTYFIHSAPASLQTHHRIFGTNVLFDQDFHGFVFPRSELDTPNDAADAEIARQMARYAERFMQTTEQDSADRVREHVAALLPTGQCNIATISDQMRLDPRTLQRHLAKDGVTFHDLVQEVRLSLAAQYLEESGRPLTEVADLLGFSALSAFSRWHRSHCGVSAKARRSAARHRRQDAEPS